jgi:hypothetical protein
MAPSSITRHLALTAIAVLAAAGPARAGQDWPDESEMQASGDRGGGMAAGPETGRAGRWEARSGRDDTPDMPTGASRWRGDDGLDGHGRFSGWGSRHGQDARDDGDRDRGRWDLRRERMMMHGMAMQHPPFTAQGARFDVQVGDTRVGVRCGPREPSRDCVDAAVSLVTRLRETTRGPSSEPSSSSGPSGPSGSGSNSGSPSPGSSTQNPP